MAHRAAHRAFPGLYHSLLNTSAPAYRASFLRLAPYSLFSSACGSAGSNLKDWEVILLPALSPTTLSGPMLKMPHFDTYSLFEHPQTERLASTLIFSLWQALRTYIGRRCQPAPVRVPVRVDRHTFY